MFEDRRRTNISLLSSPASSGERVPRQGPAHQPDLQNDPPRAGGPQAGRQDAVHSQAAIDSLQGQVPTVTQGCSGSNTAVR